MPLWLVAAMVFALNVPFGYWRDNVDKYSRQWFIAIHAPVPGVIALRLLSGLGWQLITFPVLIGSFFAGQLAGGYWHRLRSRSMMRSAGSCLVMDLFRRQA